MPVATSVVEVSNDVHDHGTFVNAKRNRVECNYCSKEVAGFSRLKYHLGQVRGDVKPCTNVPEGVKILMRESLLKRKTNEFNREVTQLIPLDQPSSKRSLSSSSNSFVTAKRKRKRLVVDSVPENSTPEMDLESWTEVLVSESASKNIKYEVDLSRPVKRNIARFFVENGLDSSAASSTSFKQMVDAIIARGGSIGFEIPSCDELSSLIQDEMIEIHQYVKEVRQSWRSTGCTIMLDGWTDEKGCSLINFLVDCPKGPIFLKSADITNAFGDVNDMISLLDQVIKDVGVENVVQVITYTKSDFMDKVGTKLMDKYKTIFWSVCASHCITLMLQKIGMMKTMRRVWSKANTITKFICSDDTLSRVLRKHTHGLDLIVSSRIKQAIPFLTLDNIVSKNKKGNIKTFFDSSTWKTSNWAHTAKGREVSSLVKDPTFWTEASLVLNATIPLVSYLLLINGEDGKIPYIYETMDQVKEKIKYDIPNKNKYMPIWDAIDEIWDNILHSPLHSAGYFLNPNLSYSSDFASDSEVASGLLSCIVRMVEVHDTQALLTQQIEMYQRTMGTFGEEVAKDDSRTLSPVKWWSLYGSQCPDLQEFAIRILSQTCCGASGYNLRRSSSEQLQKCVEQNRLNDLMFVEHNARLQHSLSVNNNNSNITNSNFVLEHTKEMDDFFMVMKQELNSGCWDAYDLVMVAEQELINSGRDGSVMAMVGEQELNIENDDFAWSDTDEAIILRGVVSSFELPPFGLVMDN